MEGTWFWLPASFAWCTNCYFSHCLNGVNKLIGSHENQLVPQRQGHISQLKHVHACLGGFRRFRRLGLKGGFDALGGNSCRRFAFEYFRSMFIDDLD